MNKMEELAARIQQAKSEADAETATVCAARDAFLGEIKGLSQRLKELFSPLLGGAGAGFGAAPMTDVSDSVGTFKAPVMELVAHNLGVRFVPEQQGSEYVVRIEVGARTVGVLKHIQDAWRIYVKDPRPAAFPLEADTLADLISPQRRDHLQDHLAGQS